MPSDEEFRELKDQVASLSSALATARRRIDDLEDGMADHLGLDWGESLVDVNSPHPNISANTIESGGGIIRQDARGMQIVPTASSDTPAIIWLRRFIQATDTLTGLYSYLSSQQSDSSTNISAYAHASATSFAHILGYAGSSSSSASLTAYNGTYGEAHVQVSSNFENVGIYLSGRIATFGNICTPAQITGNQDNYSPSDAFYDMTSATVFRLSTDASRDITGLAQSGGVNHVVILFNVGSFNIVLKNDVTSTAANRFLFSADITLAPNEGVTLMYDTTSERWRCFGRY